MQIIYHIVQFITFLSLWGKRAARIKYSFFSWKPTHNPFHVKTHIRTVHRSKCRIASSYYGWRLKPRFHLLRFVVDLLYNKAWTRCTTKRRLHIFFDFWNELFFIQIQGRGGATSDSLVKLSSLRPVHCTMYILISRVGFLPAETCFCRASGLNRFKPAKTWS